MNLGQFIDTFKDAIAHRVVESYPPLYRPSENGHRLPRLLRKPLGAQEDAIHGARPSPSKPTGAPPSSARWARARPSSPPPPRIMAGFKRGFWSSARPTWCPSGSGRWR